MESSSSTAIIAELETAKSACLEIMSPVVMSAEKLGNENNLLQDKISALELELSNAKAENLALQGRVNELQECNVLIGSTNERISAQVTAHFTEKEDLERKISELSKVPNPETFNNMVAANRMYKSEVCQLRDHCNLLVAQARSLQESIVGKGPLSIFSHGPSVAEPPTNLTKSLNRQIDTFKRGLKRGSETL